MTRATWRQRLCGLRKKDLAKLNRTETEAIATAIEAAERQRLHRAAVDPAAHPIVYGNRIAWYVVSRKIATWPPSNGAVIDDETGEVLGVQCYKR